MKQHRTLTFCTGWALCLTLAVAATAPAASSLSNSLTGFTGNTSEAGTIAALAAAGLEIGAYDSFDDNTFPGQDPVVYDGSGATFGSMLPGTNGRAYMRTVENYAFDSYVAEVTVVVDTLATDVPFMGMGTGTSTRWGTPDWAGVPTVFMSPNNGNLESNSVQGISGDWENPPACTTAWCTSAAPGLVGTAAGTHRLRMTLDADAKTWVGSVDIDYTGGAFVADVSTPTYNFINMYNDGGFVTIGWDEFDPLANPSRIYFGGSDGAIFKDFSVAVAGAALLGDYNENNVVDAGDYTKWRDNLGGTVLANDPTPGTIDSTDYDYWKAHFGAVLGAGSGAGAAGVPEPSTFVLLTCALCGALALRRER